MPNVNLNSINSSVSYAESILDKIINEEIIYSFFLGNVEAPTKSASSEERRRDVYKDAAFFKKIPSSAVDIVVERNDFEQKSYNTWSANSDSLSNYYCYHNGNMYLVIGNNENNTTQDDGKVFVSPNAPPTHTWGIKKKAGYEYLFLFSTEAQNEVVLRSNLWVPVPKTSTSLPYYNGSLLEKKIDIDSLASISFSYDNPEIPILSDTGSGATITLVTIPTTKSGTTKSKRRFKIVGIQASPGVNYEDFDLSGSLSSALPNESGANLTAIENAITIGFAPIQLTARKILQANHTLITATVTATEIKTVTDQTKFFSHGLVEGLKTPSGGELFTKDDTSTLKSNNLKITTAKTPLLSATVQSSIGTVGSQLFAVSGTTTNQKAKLASSQVSGTNLASEAQINKNPFSVGNGIKVGKNGATFIITAITEPSAKEGSGSVINISDTNYNIASAGSAGDTFPKTFVTQYLNRYN